MAKKKPLLDQMRANPKADWTIEKVETVCSQNGVNCDKPSNGSHYSVWSDLLGGALPVPRKRPIRPVYIRQLVGLIDAHIAAEAAQQAATQAGKKGTAGGVSAHRSTTK